MEKELLTELEDTTLSYEEMVQMLCSMSKMLERHGDFIIELAETQKFLIKEILKTEAHMMSPKGWNSKIAGVWLETMDGIKGEVAYTREKLLEHLKEKNARYEDVL